MNWILSLSILILLSISPLAFAQNSDQAERYKSLAEYWSPVICQDVDESNFLADYILKFDYDGDYNAWNNSENLKQKWNLSVPAVYYWVAETETHYFIGYGIFHPIDWKIIPQNLPEYIWHENDFEGVVTCIKKNEPVGESEGEFVALVSQAHGTIKNYIDNDQRVSREFLSGYGCEDFTDLDFVEDDLGKHPLIYVEARGHGVYANFNSSAGDIPIPSCFCRIPVLSTICDRAENWATGVIETPKFISKVPGIYKNELVLGSHDVPELLTNESKWDRPDKLGIVYVYNCTNRPHPRNIDELKGWPMVGYELVQINSLWDGRYNTSCGDKIDGLYSEYGIFGGINISNHPLISIIDITSLISLKNCSLSAKAPWGWCEEEFDVFMNPINYFANTFNLYGDLDYSQVYVGKSYGTVYETHHPYDRHEMRISWTVTESEYLDLIFGRVELDDDTPLYVYSGGILRRVLQNETRLRVVGDTFSLNTCPKGSNSDTLPWGFVLNRVNSVPYIVRGDKIRFNFDENSSIDESALPTKDPDGPSEIKYKIFWNKSHETEWISEIDHTFEDDDMYDSCIWVRLFDGLSESETYQIPLSVRNVPPSPEIRWQKLQNSSNDSENKSVEFAIYAGDSAGEYDEPYTYSFTLVRLCEHDIGGNISANGSINSTANLMDELSLNETWEDGTSTVFERCIPAGNYTAAVTVQDDGGASGSAEISLSLGDQPVCQ